MWILILLLLVFLLDLYVFIAYKNEICSHLIYKVFYWAPLAGLALLFLVYTQEIIFIHQRGWHIYFRSLLMIIYISKLLILIPLLMDDLRRGIIFLRNKISTGTDYDASRNRFLKTTGIILGAVPFFTLTYGMVRNPYRYQLISHTLKVPDLPEDLEGLRIVQISDIHSGSYKFIKPVSDGIAMIQELKPDLLVFTGDLVNAVAEEAKSLLPYLKKLNAPYGMFSVLGNHDYGDYYDWQSPEDKIENMEQLYHIQKEIGWDLLLNENRTIRIGSTEIGIIGVENFSALPYFPRYGDLSEAAKGVDPHQFNILLTHDPSHWDYEVNNKYKFIDLTLSGHTHGFQFGVEVPGWVRWSPSQYVYDQWAGIYKKDRQWLNVNRGFGFLGYPGRVGILPEITLITLEKETEI